MTVTLLLDEMLTATVAEQLRARGHDATAVVHNPALTGLADDDILAAAAADGRALVTTNVKDFIPLDHHYKASGRTHAGLILVSTKTFPQDRALIGALVAALDRLINDDAPAADALHFLQR